MYFNQNVVEAEERQPSILTMEQQNGLDVQTKIHGRALGVCAQSLVNKMSIRHFPKYRWVLVKMGQFFKGRDPRHMGPAMFEAKGAPDLGLTCAKQHSLPETYKRPIAKHRIKDGQSHALGGPKPPPPPQPPPPLERLPYPLS